MILICCRLHGSDAADLHKGVWKMIISYKANMAGPYHIDNGIPCQDSYAVKKGKDNFIIAAVADGLGSEKYSDIGSKVAVNSVVEECAENISADNSFEDNKKLMTRAMINAYKAVLARAKEDGNNPNEYDSTLCLCAYDGEKLFYAQSGDSGMLALMENGEYRRVTVQQRDDEGRVFPLCFGPGKWEFGCIDEPVSAVMLMTDGVLDNICPPIMRNMEIAVNVPLAQKFMDHFDVQDDKLESLEEAAASYLRDYPRDCLDDDKTIVVLINTERKPQKLDPEYYAPPDWEALQREAEARLWSNTEVPKQDTEQINDDDADVSLPEDEEKPAENNEKSNDSTDMNEDKGTLPITESIDEESVDVDEPSTSGKRFKLDADTSLDIILVFLLFMIGILSWLVSKLLLAKVDFTVLGSFFTSVLSHAAVFLPDSCFEIAVKCACTKIPLLAGVLAAVGASLGEMVAYCMGRFGESLLPKRLVGFLRKRVSPGFLAVTVFSALPLPIFDIVGIFFGAVRMKTWRFLAACFCGKLIKFATYISLAQEVIKLVG